MQADASRVPVRERGPVDASGPEAARRSAKTRNYIFQDTRPAHFISPVGLHRITRMREMKLQDLKSKTPTELVSFAEEHEVENASTMRKQELMFAILKQLASKEIEIIGEGEIRSPKEGERYFALLKVNTINFEDPEKSRHKVNFDNLTPLYPDERLKMEHE